MRCGRCVGSGNEEGVKGEGERVKGYEAIAVSDGLIFILQQLAKIMRIH